MEKDTKVILGAVLIMFVSMLSFNLNKITGKATNEELPDLVGEANFIDLETGEKLTYAKLGDRADIIVKITNKGTDDAPPGNLKNKVNYRLELKKDGSKVEERNLKKTFFLGNTIKPQDYTIVHLSYITGAKGKFKEYQFNAPGKYCLDVKVDTGKKLGESDENNDFLGIGCVIVTEEGKPLPVKEEVEEKEEKVKTCPATTISVRLLEIGAENEILLDQEICTLRGNKDISCSFDADLEINTNYIVRGSTSNDCWEVKLVRILDSSSQEYLGLRKSCSKPFCELNTEEFLKPKTKRDQLIKSGEYIIEGSAKIA